MQIIFPPLVEEGYRYCRKQGIVTTKQEVFLELVAKGILKENGDPTAAALSAGYVADFTEVPQMTFAEFLAVYPVFQRYPVEHFTQLDGFWEIDRDLLKTLQQELDANYLTADEELQLAAFLEDRQLAD